MSEPSENAIPTKSPVCPDEMVWRSMVVSLREIRVARRISIRTLAQKIIVNPAHLSRMERGGTIPSVILAFRWCRALCIEFGPLYHSARRTDEEACLVDLSRDIKTEI